MLKMEEVFKSNKIHILRGRNLYLPCNLHELFSSQNKFRNNQNYRLLDDTARAAETIKIF